MHIGDLFTPVTSRDKILDHATAERSRAVQRNERNEIGEIARRKLFDE